MTTERKLRERLIAKDTKKYGNGVFSAKEIKKGEIIHVLSGERMSPDEFAKRDIKKAKKLHLLSTHHAHA